MLQSTRIKRITIFNDNSFVMFYVHEWAARAKIKWIVGSAMPDGVSTSYGNYIFTITNVSYGIARIVYEDVEDSSLEA